jgi:hypothetical protein
VETERDAGHPLIRIFLNYRRDDSSGYALSLYRDLVDHFGAEQVFMDIDTISPGENFVERIEETMSTCDVVVALVGRGWLSATDEKGGRRLDDPEDFVRLELESAVERKVPLVPTLVHGARMPDRDDLPESLHPVALRQAIELHDTSWDADVARLIGVFERLARRAQPPAREDVAPARPGEASGSAKTRRRPSITLHLPTVPIALRRRWRAALLVAGAVIAGVVALVLLLPGPSIAALGAPGQIAFLRGGVISKMNGDASSITPLYRGQVSSTGYGVGTVSTFSVRPSWSPDRKHIAFAKDGDIWILSAGDRIRDITNTPSISEGEPAWSPDGRRIAFGAYPTAAGGCTNVCEKVYVMDPNGRQVMQLTPAGTWYDYLPAWSPDGKQIAFTSNRSGAGEIWVMNADGGNERQLTHFRGQSLLPAWSPDGKRIAFETDASDPKYATCDSDNSCVYDIAVLKIGSTQNPLGITHAPVGTSDVWPSWLTSRQLLFTASSGLLQDIWTISADGSGIRQLTFDHESQYTDVAR